MTAFSELLMVYMFTEGIERDVLSGVVNTPVWLAMI